MTRISHSWRALGVLAASLAFATAMATALAADAERMPIKVVVVAMFENGGPPGDDPGELQLWVERLPLPIRVAFPAGESDLFLNDDGVLAFVTGGGIPNATASTMALGLDSRFDLSRAVVVDHERQPVGLVTMRDMVLRHGSD